MNRSKSPTHGSQHWNLVIPSDLHQLALARPVQFKPAEALAQLMGLGNAEKDRVGLCLGKAGSAMPGLGVLSPSLSPWEK